MLLERLLLLLVGVAIGFFASLPFSHEPPAKPDPCAELGLEVARLRRRVAELEARLEPIPPTTLPSSRLTLGNDPTAADSRLGADPR